MKFFKSAAYALMASQLTAAAPAADIPEPGAIVEYRSVNEAHAALATLDKRLTCQRIGQVMRTIGTSSVIVAFISVGGDFAEVVCQLANGARCDIWAKAIRIGFYLVYQAARQSDGAIPEGLPQRRDNIGEDAGIAAAAWWRNALAGEDLAYDSIETEPFDASEAHLARRGDNDPQLLARVRLAGLVDAETGHKHEIIAHHFEGNSTVLHIPQNLQQSVSAANGTAGGSLDKRFDGAGFKISYTTRERSKLTMGHEHDMAGALADSWVAHSKIQAMDDFMGLAKTGHSANFYYRVIPEVRGFGLNYESVDECGGMAGFL